jgi:hypothetical protein
MDMFHTSDHDIDMNKCQVGWPKKSNPRHFTRALVFILQLIKNQTLVNGYVSTKKEAHIF